MGRMWGWREPEQVFSRIRPRTGITEGEGGGGWRSEGKMKKMTWKGGGNKANKGGDRLWVDNT